MRRMVAFARLLIGFLASWFRSRAEIGAEILILRHQLQVLSRKAPQRPRLNMADRILLVWLYRICPGVLSAVTIVKPETVIRWHRRAFRAYWRWKSRGRPGRPKVAKEIRDLIREMSLANPSWGAPRIHGELRMLGIEVAQSTVSKYMAMRRAPPSQGWKTFLRNHADGIAAIDLFVVPTAALRLLFAFVVLRHGRRELVSFGVTRAPTAEWLAQQLSEAFPWETAPTHPIRDRDAIYGVRFRRRVRAMGIRVRPTAPRSPWQNGHVERLIGSIRRECLDHQAIFGEAHLRCVLQQYADYYNGIRTHLSLAKDAPHHRQPQVSGRITPTPILHGLHHAYVRI